MDWVTTGLGVVAGCCSTVSFVPQIIKAIREHDTGAISRRTYIINVTAFVLWIAYGFALDSFPLIAFNALSLLMSGTILVMKLREGDKSPPA